MKSDNYLASQRYNQCRYKDMYRLIQSFPPHFIPENNQVYQIMTAARGKSRGKTKVHKTNSNTINTAYTDNRIPYVRCAKCIYVGSTNKLS